MKNINIDNVKKSLESTYLKKDYRDTIESLLKYRDDSDLGLFHYNLGTLHAKLKNFAFARYNLEKAVVHGYLNTKTINNLNYVQSHLVVEDISNSNDLADKGLSYTSTIPSGFYLMVSLLLFLLILFLWFKKKITSKIIFSVFALIAIAPFLLSKFYFCDFVYAVNLKEIKVYQGPSKVYEEKRSVKAGSKFLISGPSNGWYFIEKPISLSGWIEKKDLGIL